MKVVNSWLGRLTGPPLVMLLIATTCHATTFANSPAQSETATASSSLGVEASEVNTLWLAHYVQESAPAQQDTPAPQPGQPATAQQPAQQTPYTYQPTPPQPGLPQPAQASPTASPQTTPAPIVHAPALGTPDPQAAPMPPASAPGQQTAPPANQTSPGTNQPYTGDQQYNIPSDASQRLSRRPLGPEPVVAPSSETAQPIAPPVGTAVAPVIKASGTAGSRVAGAAVAPAKQRRIRTFAIRAALIVGAAVAIGVVAGASKASPARATQ